MVKIGKKERREETKRKIGARLSGKKQTRITKAKETNLILQYLLSATVSLS